MTHTTELACHACRRPTDPIHPVACPSCIGQTRNAIRTILDRVAECEAEYLAEASRPRRGFDSPVFMVAMPAANYETSTYVHQSATSGRLCRCRTRGWDTCVTDIDPETVCPDAAFVLDTHKDDLRHPSTVLQAHALHWRRLNGHDQPTTPTLDTEARYLLEHLTRMAQLEDADLARLRTETTATADWLDAILRIGTPTEKGSPCPDCRGPRLTRDIALDATGHRAPWACPSTICGAEYTDDELTARFARDYLSEAEHLAAPDLAVVLNVPLPTIRRWAARQKRQKGGQPVYLPPLLTPTGTDAVGRATYRVDTALTIRDTLRRETTA